MQNIFTVCIEFSVSLLPHERQHTGSLHVEYPPCDFGGALGLCKLTLNYSTAYFKVKQVREHGTYRPCFHNCEELQQLPGYSSTWAVMAAALLLIHGCGARIVAQSCILHSYSGCRQRSAYAPTEACICVNLVLYFFFFKYKYRPLFSDLLLWFSETLSKISKSCN